MLGLVCFSFILAQEGPPGEVSEEEIYFNPLDPTAQGNILSQMLTRAAGFETAVEVSLITGGRHTIYDSFGESLMDGIQVVDFSYLKRGDKVEARGGRYAYELRDPEDDEALGSDMRFGLSAPVGPLNQTILVGKYISMDFTPYTLSKKNSLFGLRWDFVHPKRYWFISTFFTDRFKDTYKEPTGVIEYDDRLFGAVRVAAKLKKILKPVFSKRVLRKINWLNVGVSAVAEGLRNGMKDDNGSEEMFLKNFSEGEKIRYSDYVVGLDVKGLLFRKFVFTLESGFSKNKWALIGDFNSDFEKDYKLEDYADYILYTELGLERILPSVSNITLRYWSIGKNYDASFAVDDDDDGDGWLDDNIDNDPYFPYQRGDTDLDEPNKAVIPKVLNKNENDIPDYVEPFLSYPIDIDFYAALKAEDVNHNGVLDILENDNLPDYPYKQGRRGLSTGISLLLPLDFELSYLFTHEFSLFQPSNRCVSHALDLATERSLGQSGKLSVELYWEKVWDTLADDVYVRDEFYEDELLFRDNFIWGGMVKTYYQVVPGLLWEQKAKVLTNARVWDGNYGRCLKFLEKAKYTIPWKSTTTSVSFKYEISKFNAWGDTIAQDLLAKLETSHYFAFEFTEAIEITPDFKLKAGFFSDWYKNLDFNDDWYHRKTAVCEFVAVGPNTGSYWTNRGLAMIIGAKWYSEKRASAEDNWFSIYAKMWVNI